MIAASNKRLDVSNLAALVHLLLTICRVQSTFIVARHGGRSGRGGIRCARAAAAHRTVALLRADGPQSSFHTGSR